MRTADMIKSKFIRGKDLEGRPPMTLTIADVSEELVGRGGRQESKCILWFHEDHRGLSINKARVGILEAAYGPDSDLWSGKKVRLFFDPNIEFGGRAVGGVGIKTPAGVVYRGDPNAGAWGAPAQTAAPAGAPPPPVWDGTQWVTQPAPARPPAPVWDGTKWVVVDPSTGEIAPPKHVPPPTISQRVNANHPPAADPGWDNAPPGAGGEADFNDDIPF
jgi:hypothetical protein